MVSAEADFYQRHFQTYFETTVGIDPTSFLTLFAQSVSRGSRVWDIGCGSGRDLLWLKKRGFRPTGLERSIGLARLARGHSGRPVVVGDFENFDFSRIHADGMLLTATLVHVPPHRVKVILSRILTGLKSEGVLFISMKKGAGTVEDDATGRRFYLWQSKTLESIFQALNLTVMTVSSNASALGTNETWLAYLLRKG